MAMERKAPVTLKPLGWYEGFQRLQEASEFSEAQVQLGTSLSSDMRKLWWTPLAFSSLILLQIVMGKCLLCGMQSKNEDGELSHNLSI